MAVAVALLVVVGIYNLVWGTVAVATDDWFIVDELVYGDNGFWGVVYIVLGLADLAAAAGIRRGSRRALWLAVVVTVLSALDALASAPQEPVWALVALLVYGMLLVILVPRLRPQPAAQTRVGHGG